MVRSLFLAIGIFICVIGAECLLIETAVFTQRGEAAASGAFSESSMPQRKEISPPDWAPWGCLAAGAVVMIYSITIPRRVQG